MACDERGPCSFAALRGLFVPKPSSHGRVPRRELRDLVSLSFSVRECVARVAPVVTQLVTHHGGHSVGR